MELQRLIRYSFLFASIGTLAACSSAETGTATTPVAPTPVTISGSIFASSVNQATVTVKDDSGNTIAGPVLTATDGTYSVDMLDTDLTGDLVFESSGGEFTDEETGAANVAAGSMSAYVTGDTLASGDSVHVTPGTSVCAELVTKHGKTSTQALTDYFSAFAYNPDISVEPVDVADSASFTAADDSRHAGWRAAVFSRLANTLTLQADEQFDMFAAMAQDLSDGKLDGVDASGAVNIGTTGKTLPTDIKAQYITAAGSFTTAEAANLKVTYTPLTMNNAHGKNQFTLEITDTAGIPVTGLTATDLKVMPMMYMADRTHATPMGEIVETVPGVSGIYNVTAYYLMPSRMMDGTTMGTWDLKVMANMKTVHFYPNINMAMMTNTARVQLKGVNDTIIDMSGLEVPRTYNLFRDGLVQQGGGNTYDFDIFIAPIENMMSFPALINGMTLTSGMGGTPYDVSGVSVEASVNDGNTWDTGTDNTNGTWSFNALNLNNPGTNEIRVRLTVSGEIKTTNGLTAQTGANDFTTFTVTLP
jgi:hypothetical protein